MGDDGNYPIEREDAGGETNSLAFIALDGAGNPMDKNSAGDDEIEGQLAAQMDQLEGFHAGEVDLVGEVESAAERRDGAFGYFLWRHTTPGEKD